MWHTLAKAVIAAGKHAKREQQKAEQHKGGANQNLTGESSPESTLLLDLSAFVMEQLHMCLDIARRQLQLLVTPELRDLAVGTMVVGSLIAFCFLRQTQASNQRQQRAMNRSLSCPALVELNSKTALNACAEMMAAFDDRRRYPKQRLPRLPSLPALVEVDSPRESHRGSRRASEESLTDEVHLSSSPRHSVSSSPRGRSPPHSQSPPRTSPYPSPRSTSPRRSDCASLVSSMTASPTSSHAASPRDGRATPIEMRSAVNSPASASFSSDHAGSFSPLPVALGGNAASGYGGGGGGGGGFHSPLLAPGSVLAGAGPGHHGAGAGNSGHGGGHGSALSGAYGGGGGGPAGAAHGWAVDLEPLSPPPPPNLIVLGDGGVGKSEIVRVLEGFAAKNLVELNLAEGLPTELTSCQAAASYAVPLIIWEADLGSQQDEPLASYVARHLRLLVERLHERLSGSSHAVADRPNLLRALQARLLVMCNKSDLQPCPLPEIAALEPGTIFLAGSATRGTNMKELWRYVEMCAAPRLHGPPPVRVRPRVVPAQPQRMLLELPMSGGAAATVAPPAASASTASTSNHASNPPAAGG